MAEKRVDFAYNAATQYTTITRYKDTDGGGSNLVAETDYGYDDIGPFHFLLSYLESNRKTK